MRILMCNPSYFDIEYEINPWMNVQKKADRKRAHQQWENLYKTIRSCGATIDLVAPGRGLPDMCFTANAGLYYQGRIVLSHFHVIERKGETAYYQAWFEQAGFEVVNRPGYDQVKPYFEGAGDALLAGDVLFAGYGFRSEKKFYEETKEISKSKMILCELADSYYYHIDTCFCPLNEKLAIWCPKAFTPESQKKMASHIELIEVIDEEAKRFACNAVVIGKHVVIPSGCPNLTDDLKKRGFTVHACEVDEYIKSGGACKCLTMRIDGGP